MTDKDRCPPSASDRAYGFIDEVRLTDRALSTNQFLFAVNSEVYVLEGPARTNQTVVTGDPCTLSIRTWGAPGLGLQWRHAGTNLAGGAWLPLFTNTCLFSFTDWNAPGYPCRRYRAVWTP